MILSMPPERGGPERRDPMRYLSSEMRQLPWLRLALRVLAQLPHAA